MIFGIFQYLILLPLGKSIFPVQLCVAKSAANLRQRAQFFIACCSSDFFSARRTAARWSRADISINWLPATIASAITCVKISSTWNVRIFRTTLKFRAVMPIETRFHMAYFLNARCARSVVNFEQFWHGRFQVTNDLSKQDKFGKSTCAVVAFYARIAGALTRMPASQHGGLQHQ